MAASRLSVNREIILNEKLTQEQRIVLLMKKTIDELLEIDHEHGNSLLLIAAKNAQDQVIRTILDRAIKENKQEAIKTILLHYDESGRNILHNSSYIPDNQLVIATLCKVAEEIGINDYVNYKEIDDDSNGLTSLHIATTLCRFENAEALIDSGAEVDATDKYGRRFADVIPPIDQNIKNSSSESFSRLLNSSSSGIKKRFNEFYSVNSSFDVLKQLIAKFDQFINENSALSYLQAWIDINEHYSTKLISLNIYVSALQRINYALILDHQLPTDIENFNLDMVKIKMNTLHSIAEKYPEICYMKTLNEEEEKRKNKLTNHIIKYELLKEMSYSKTEKTAFKYATFIQPYFPAVAFRLLSRLDKDLLFQSDVIFSMVAVDVDPIESEFANLGIETPYAIVKFKNRIYFLSCKDKSFSFIEKLLTDEQVCELNHLIQLNQQPQIIAEDILHKIMSMTKLTHESCFNDENTDHDTQFLYASKFCQAIVDEYLIKMKEKKNNKTGPFKIFKKLTTLNDKDKHENVKKMIEFKKSIDNAGDLYDLIKAIELLPSQLSIKSIIIIDLSNKGLMINSSHHDIDQCPKRFNK